VFQKGAFLGGLAQSKARGGRAFFGGGGCRSYPEAYIESFFAIKSNQDKPYNGLITFFDFDDILWE